MRTKHTVWLSNNWVHSITDGLYLYVTSNNLWCPTYVMDDYGFLVKV